MERDHLPHLIIDKDPRTESYTTPRTAIITPNIPPRNRFQHGNKVKRQFEKIWQDINANDEQRQAVSLSILNGVYLEFISEAGYDLITQSLENLALGIRLLNIHQYENNGQKLTKATIYVPKLKISAFLNKINDYLDESKDGANPKNYKLVNSIEDIKLAVLESFWSDPTFAMPQNNEMVWCEIWLRTDDESLSGEDAFFKICSRLKIEFNRQEVINFPERKVVMVKADKTLLTKLLSESEYIAEFRRARETARFWVELENKDQVEWVRHALERLSVESDSLISVCVLDTGVNNGHDLLLPVIPDENCFTVNPDWNVDDKNGHGTLMCGVVIYGDLKECLEKDDAIEIMHSIESVKILQQAGEENDPHLYGFLTEQGVYYPESKFPDKKRILCMAVTSKEFSDGRPTSWSGSIDKLTSGMEDDNRRLFIVSAGNIEEEEDWRNYPESNMSLSILDPAQSWNALTIGAFTSKDKITDPNLDGYQALAKQGELSPFSRTSWGWSNKWPAKPDVVFEGGNLATNGTNIGSVDDLSILSTAHIHTKKQFEVINATSAATANASWFASQLQLNYPTLWPETIRGLIVHSAEWTEALKKQFCSDRCTPKENYSNLLKTCGYGVPNLEKALYSAGNELTLIAEKTLQPYYKEGSNYKTKDMHILELPWPKDILLGMGDTPVKLKITLSYFIEPGPGEIGWKDRYRYQSHALRFALKLSGDEDDEFIKRLSTASREEDENIVSTSDTRWMLGPNNRNKGSIHSDSWTTTAAELSTCNMIGIYPVIGWWRERHHLGAWDKMARYSIIVSLDTPETEVDLYTPIEIALKTPIPVQTDI